MRDPEFTGSAFTIHNWPTMSEEAAESMRELEKSHTIRLLPFFVPRDSPTYAGLTDEEPEGSYHWKLMSPRAYKREVPGSLMAVTIAVERIHDGASRSFTLRPQLMHIQKMVACSNKFV
jgi:hypothetical protein